MTRFMAILELFSEAITRLEGHVEGAAKLHDPDDQAFLVAAKTALEVFRIGTLVPIGTPIGISEEDLEALRHVKISNKATAKQQQLARQVIDRLIASATGGAIVYPTASEEKENAPADLGPQGKHCDDYIHDFTAPHCLRFFLLINRLPAMDMMVCREFGVKPKLFATYKDTRVRVVMASRMGDVGITHHLDAEDGYQARVMIAALSNFGEAP